MEGGVRDHGSLGLISFAASTVALVAYMYKRSEKYRVGIVRPRKGIWKHDLARKALPEEMLQTAFKRIKEEFEPQLVTYKGQRWKISTYMELDNSGHISGKHKVDPDIKMLNICQEMLDECTRLFEIWYNSDRKLKYCKAERLHSFVTRYLPIEGQDQLKKHIDGRHLDGSCILRLPTDSPCKGGQVKVWDRMVQSGKKGPTKEFFYPMKAGDVCFLDRAVWHQAMPITDGIKWAIIIFFKVHRKPPKADVQAL